MAESFAFQAPTFYNFNDANKKDESFEDDDVFFEINTSDDKTISEEENGVVTTITESKVELNAPESDVKCYSPMESAGIHLHSKLRRSLSLNNLDAIAERAIDDQAVLHSDRSTSNRPFSSSASNSQICSQDHINKLAQPKRYHSRDNLDKTDFVSLAEGVKKFQLDTPKRFRSKANVPKVKAPSVPWGLTKAHTPKLLTAQRSRPQQIPTREEIEIQEFIESQKFKIRANPVNKKILQGPLKPELEKKPATKIEPFHITEVAKKEKLPTHPEPPKFQAQPVPKSLHQPFKVQKGIIPATVPESPHFSKRFVKESPKKFVPKKIASSPKPIKPTRTQLMPFSFENRDQQIREKRELLIKRTLEEEKRAREFHANPVPKIILRNKSASNNHLSEMSSPPNSHRRNSTESTESVGFKARPADVLKMKPFKPKKTAHEIQVEAFQLHTEQRREERLKFEQQLKEQREQLAKHCEANEELRKKREEEEIAILRKQKETKANPIKKYKPVEIKPSGKVTQPISPNFHTDRIRNKENINGNSQA